MSGWGLKFFDYDNDGNLDLFLCNGNPDDLIQVVRKDVGYEEPMLLFHGNGKSFSERQRGKRPGFRPDRCQHAEWRSATLTTTAQSMCWYRSMTARRSSCETMRPSNDIGSASIWLARNPTAMRLAHVSPIRLEI